MDKRREFKGFCSICHNSVYYRWKGIEPRWECTGCGIVMGGTYKPGINVSDIKPITAADTLMKTLQVKSIKLSVLNTVMERTFNKTITEKELIRAGYRITGVKIKTIHKRW